MPIHPAQSCEQFVFPSAEAAGRVLSAPCPRPQENEVLVEVAAAALNFADLLSLKDQYQEQTRWPHIPGMEFSGIVVAVGSLVDAGLIGKQVACYPGRGGLSTHALCTVDRLVRLPDRCSVAEAAAIPIAYGTSHLALTRNVPLSAKHTVIVLGASGGVGLTAVEMANQMGARVIACARGAKKCDVAARAGAHATVDTATTDDLKSALRALGGADVIYDAVGGDAGLAAFGALRPGGHFLIIGFASGTPPTLPLNHALVKNITLSGFYWGGLQSIDPQAVQKSLDTVFGWYAEGRIKPHISHRLPLERTGDGLELLRSRAATGKILILP